jgi:phosphate transport system substrate-binding protein
MSQKNETATLVITLAITIAGVSAGLWWLSQTWGINPFQNSIRLPQPSQPQQAPEKTAIAGTEGFVNVPNVPVGLFNYGGSTTWAPIRGTVDPAVQTVWTQFKLRYTNPIAAAPGSGTGIKMLLDGQLAFAQSSRPLEDAEYQQAAQRGFKLKEIPVALDGIALAVHPDLPVPGLTLAQIKDIYTSKVTNWRQVGGPDLAIIPYSRPVEAGGTSEFFVKNLLGGDPLGRNVNPVGTTTEALRLVSKALGGVYYASAPEVVGQCTVKSLAIARKPNEFVPPHQEPWVPLAQCPAQRNQLNAQAFQTGEYPITRRLFVIVKENGQIDQQAGEAYANLLLTAQGQELIAKAGFVRLR